MSHRIVEHTADLAIEATAATAGEALSEAAQALTGIVTGRTHHGDAPTGEVVFEVEAPDLQALAVAFLAELLWFLETRDLLWLSGGADVEQRGGMWHASARGNAALYEPQRHGQGTEVKAVTYHQIFFGRDGAGWRLFVVVDI